MNLGKNQHKNRGIDRAVRRALGRGSVLIAAAVLSACAAKREERDVLAQEVQYEMPAAAPVENEVIQASPVTGDGRGAVANQVARAEARMKLTSAPMAPPPMMAMPNPADTERYQHQKDNGVQLAAEQPVSTFSIDVDTGSYANVRRFLNDGRLPPQDAVRVEEMINYFDYDYAPPGDRETPFRVSTELAAAPWNSQALLMRIGIKGFEVEAKQRPAANLVFLIDVSGSMDSPDKLPLLKNAFRLLTDQLTGRDRVSMVVYAGSSGVVLEPTPGDQKHRIQEALARLSAGGSTNGASGIERAYQLAHDTFVKGGINRVVLATDGDFNVGTVNFEALVDIVERERATGVELTTLGFGTGNYNEQLMERLADAGNGNYAYIDTLSEARKVLVSQLSSTLYTIAKDVKIQVEFNPAEVLEYRLIGYENRMLAREDFNNDKVDAGEIGAGHRVTALYEVVPVGSKGRLDPLRYGAKSEQAAGKGELANVRLRYKKPGSDSSELLEYPIRKDATVAADKLSPDFRFAASVAAFGQLLRGGKYLGDFGYDDVTKLAGGALGEDRDGYRREFVSLVALARSLTPPATPDAGKMSQISR
ncbi:VWA domain-containing protein [Steroidobacter sp. S1-65]|uniref:VWA domain-containing protein n=1 Tax=Steroidobacter gossypii TaxID=2805490 RepID=A0ABS1X2Y8_9GAMM|nr:VWA domain-containing protein [Steroidobacter gossypii]MBM0107585.1 VWA domain-containing protein [Steroidobacter gossypii]